MQSGLNILEEDKIMTKYTKRKIKKTYELCKSMNRWSTSNLSNEEDKIIIGMLMDAREYLNDLNGELVQGHRNDTKKNVIDYAYDYQFSEV